MLTKKEKWRSRRILAVAFLLMCIGSVKAAEEPNPIMQGVDERLKNDDRIWLGTANWSVMDYPMKPVGELTLKNLKTGEAFDFSQNPSGKIRVIVEVNPPHYAWQDGTALENYKRIYEEYAGKGVEFVAVFQYGGFGHRVDKLSDDAFKQMAGEWAGKLPGTVLLDGRIGRGDRSPLRTYLGRTVTGNSAEGLAVFIQNKEGLFVYRGREYVGFGYHATRLILDRLLDESFDRAVRCEFYPEKSRDLPRVEKTAKGLLYQENFDSYDNNHAFKLEPRWGFGYANQSRVDLRARIAEGKGRGDSNAAFLHTTPHGYLVSYALRHDFPAPLKKGTIRFHIKRAEIPFAGERTETGIRKKMKIKRVFSIQFGQPITTKPAGFLQSTGEWKKETFTLNYSSEPGAVAFAESAWQEVEVICQPGQKAKIKVDGQLLGELDSEEIDSVGFRLFNKEKKLLVDDFEIFYEGNAEELLLAHQRLKPDREDPVQPFTAEEQAELFKPQKDHGGYVFIGKEQAVLPAAALPRKDITDGQKISYTFDHPVEPRRIQFESMKKEGEFIDIVEKYKGHPVYVKQIGGCPTERNFRRRTYMKSPTTFYRTQRLFNEYKPKGLIAVGITDDVGHRTASLTRQNMVEAYWSVGYIRNAIAKELGVDQSSEEIRGGVNPESYDEHLIGFKPACPKIFNRNWGTDSFTSAFGMGSSQTLLNQEGKIVFRGQGGDGHTYWLARIALDRLLDPGFDAAVRQEFRNSDLPHYKSPLLPKIEKTPEGLLYRDDFESYADAYDVVIQPRWGFYYARPCDENFKHPPYPWKKEGRNGGAGLLLQKAYEADAWCGNKGVGYDIRHILPEPLTHGTICFFVRRGWHVPSLGAPPIHRIGFTCLGVDGELSKAVTTSSKWKQEEFIIVPGAEFEQRNASTQWLIHKDNTQETGVMMKEDDWQEIKISCQPGQPATIHIDGQEVGTLDQKEIAGFQFQAETWSATYIDDVQVFYRGNADELEKRHQEATAQDFSRRLAAWKNGEDGLKYPVKRERIRKGKK